MEFEYADNEFEPVDMTPPFDNLEQVFLKLLSRPDMVQPLRALDEETGEVISTLFMSLVSEGEDTFIQIEGFSSKEYEESVFQSLTEEGGWTIVQHGIFRLKIAR